MQIREKSWLERKPIIEDLSYLEVVADILANVRTRGDIALREYSAKFDGAELTELRISPEAIKNAYTQVSEDVIEALKMAAERVEAFHRQQPLTSWMTHKLGGTLGQIVSPLDRVGVYVPGGTAPLPSSLLHAAIPAKVAGVKEIVICTPPNPAPIMLVTADLAGVRTIYQVGGAQAIAALAYGTESIPKVDKITGPGNIYVVLAKKLVFGTVGIESLPGPTETIVIADEDANPGWVAADLLAQAEHDVLASAVLLTPSENLAKEVQSEITQRIQKLSRSEIITQTFEAGSGIVLTADIAEAVQLADEYAPEHLCLSIRDPWAWIPQIHHAGGIFVGEHSFEVLGDYVAGPSHIMPTAGSARFSSPVNVWDFVRLTSLIALDPATTAQIAPAAARIAHEEGLDGHASAAEERSVKVHNSGA